VQSRHRLADDRGVGLDKARQETGGDHRSESGQGRSHKWPGRHKRHQSEDERKSRNAGGCPVRQVEVRTDPERDKNDTGQTAQTQRAACRIYEQQGCHTRHKDADDRYHSLNHALRRPVAGRGIDDAEPGGADDPLTGVC
jgi:hypothetical protein